MQIDWRKTPAYPGDCIAETSLYRGDEAGFVCVQHYESTIRVATFLPGISAVLPGDTPKTEPERSEYFSAEDRAGVEQQYNAYLRDAQDAGWVIPLSTGAACESVA